MEAEAYETECVELTLLAGRSTPGEVVLLVEHSDGYTTETSCPLTALAAFVHKLNPPFVTVEGNGEDATLLQHLVALALVGGPLH